MLRILIISIIATLIFSNKAKADNHLTKKETEFLTNNNAKLKSDFPNLKISRRDGLLILRMDSLKITLNGEFNAETCKKLKSYINNGNVFEEVTIERKNQKEIIKDKYNKIVFKKIGQNTHSLSQYVKHSYLFGPDPAQSKHVLTAIYTGNKLNKINSPSHQITYDECGRIINLNFFGSFKVKMRYSEKNVKEIKFSDSSTGESATLIQGPEKIAITMYKSGYVVKKGALNESLSLETAWEYLDDNISLNVSPWQGKLIIKDLNEAEKSMVNLYLEKLNN